MTYNRNLKDGDRVTLVGEVWIYWRCDNCTMGQLVPEHWYENRRKTKDGFYCGNGHRWSFTENEADKLRRERDRAKQQEAYWRDEAARAERQVAAAKGQVTKLRNRVKNGVCPCCNRSFANLQRHMKTKHPDWNPSQVDTPQ